MLRIFLTATSHFAGDVAATYNTDGALDQVDFSGTVGMADQAKSWILKYLPLQYEKAFLQVARAQGFVVVEEQAEITFEMFWDAYDHKRNAIRARRRWNNLSKADRAKAVAGIRPYFRYLEGTGYQSKKDPDTYLLNRSWEEYLTPPAKPKPATPRSGETTIQNHLETYANRNQTSA